MLKMMKNLINGMVLGIVSTIPGFSGGTIAIVMGFYFDLIEAINTFSKNLRSNLKFLIPILLGAIIGILFSSNLIRFFLDNYSFPTMLFLIGLIAGIIPHIFTRAKPEDGKFKFTDIILMLIPFIILVVLSFVREEPSAINNEETLNNINIPLMILFFFSGIVAAAALIIPGLSGSFILLMMGVYHFFIYSVSEIRVFFSDTSNVTLLVNICKVIIPLGIGIIIGGLSMTKLIGILLKKYSRIVYTVIIGLLSGSIFALFRHPIVYKSGISTVIIIIGIVTFILGAVLSFVMGRKKL